MNLLIFVPSLRRAGAETQAIDLANGLARAGHRTHLVAFGSEVDQAGRIDPEVRFYHLTRVSRLDRRLIAGVAKIIDEQEIDVVQGVMQYSTLLAWLAVRRSRRKPPVVAALHITVNPGLKEELQDQLVYRWLLARLPVVIFVCEAQRVYWVKKFSFLRDSARVIYNGVDAAAFAPNAVASAVLEKAREQIGISTSSVVFSCIAGFRREKAHHLLIEAFSQTPSNTVLLLAGDGETRRPTENLVRQLGLVDRVKFLGNVADSRPVIALSMATILSSTTETFSMAMLESMAMGVPVIAPRLGGLPEAIFEGQTGMLFPAGDVAALAACMNAFAADKQLARTMSSRARDKITTTFNKAKMISETEALFAALAGSRTA